MPTQNLLRFVTVANVDDEDCVGNNLLQIRKLRFGQKAQLKSTRFGQDFEVEVLARFEAGVLPVFFLMVSCRD